jgi:hypothetical protein
MDVAIKTKIELDRNRGLSDHNAKINAEVLKNVCLRAR